MSRPANRSRRYRITVWGDCGGLLASVVANARVDVSPDGGDWLLSGVP